MVFSDINLFSSTWDAVNAVKTLNGGDPFYTMTGGVGINQYASLSNAISLTSFNAKAVAFKLEVRWAMVTNSSAADMYNQAYIKLVMHYTNGGVNSSESIYVPLYEVPTSLISTPPGGNVAYEYYNTIVVINTKEGKVLQGIDAYVGVKPDNVYIVYPPKIYKEENDIASLIPGSTIGNTIFLSDDFITGIHDYGTSGLNEPLGEKVHFEMSVGNGRGAFRTLHAGYMALDKVNQDDFDYKLLDGFMLATTGVRDINDGIDQNRMMHSLMIYDANPNSSKEVGQIGMDYLNTYDPFYRQFTNIRSINKVNFETPLVTISTDVLFEYNHDDNANVRTGLGLTELQYDNDGNVIIQDYSNNSIYLTTPYTESTLRAYGYSPNLSIKARSGMNIFTPKLTVSGTIDMTNALNFWYSSERRSFIEYSGDALCVRPGTNAMLRLGATGKTTVAEGTWNFTGTVTGIVATFG